jgi:hypothetical protein
MNDFVDRAEHLRVSQGHVDHAAFDLVFRGISQLQAVQSKAVLDIDNIESVMAAFEMAGLVGRLGGLSDEEVHRLPEAVTSLVSQTVEESVLFNMSSQDGVEAVHAPPSYRGLKTLIEGIRKANHTLALLTFNYDLCVDILLNDCGVVPDYGLGPEPRQELRIELLKLHGSLNWSSDAEKTTVTPLPLRELVRNWRLGGRPPGPRSFRVREHLGRLLPGTTGHPVIIPPTWSKTGHYKNIRHVWRRAAETLRVAENIYVFGYSLPETDQFFRLLYALGTAGDTRLKRFWVFDPSPSVRGKFEGLLGQSAASRFSFSEKNFLAGSTEVHSRLRAENAIPDAGD